MAGITATGALIATGLHAAAGGSGFSRAVAGTGPVFLAFLAIHVPAGLTAVISGAIAATAPKRHGRHTRADTHQDMSPQAGVLLADLPLQADGPGQQQRHPQFAGLAPPLAAERVRSRGYCRLHQGDIHASLLSPDCDCPGKPSQYLPGHACVMFVLAGRAPGDLKPSGS